MLGLTLLGLFADASIGIVLSTADGGQHNWTARSMQPHSKLGLFVGTILGLKLGLSVGALVDIVLGTGTSDKAPLEEGAAVGAALGIADGAQLGCSVDATTLKARTRREYDTRTETGTLCGCFGRYCAGHWHLRQSTTGKRAAVGAALGIADGAQLGC